MNYPTNLSTFFETDFPLNKEGIEELLVSFETIFIKKNSVLLKEGVVEKRLRFLEKGVLREFYTNQEKETNINFYTEPEFVSDFSSLINDIPTKKYQESVTDIEMKILSKSSFLKLLDKYKCGKEFIDLTFQRLLAEKESLEYDRLTKSPEELYQQILAQKPNWLKFLPQYQIASYLGITPETLSRIRKRIS